MARRVQGQSIIEYTAVVIIILTGLWVSRDFILRGIMGKHKIVGETFSFGREWDPQTGIDCQFDATRNFWFDRACYDHYRQVQGCADTTCEDGARSKCKTASCSTP